ncbi:hypothetical protein BJI69_07045 [Luteibacter rhizovicinus DSM 16549]|uniref:Uncharacterized protein n=1 Tax=Luteibacter rhizovicinus DSM 16549 TaxID=1440763 RepID=A0A0G9HLT8_9GAMM|nr:hypothetical protein [Luteibacter rhizovicinus]APG03686.1 hypothetical protein BJI69_07045 [Luteibacter rhizovicinus DSM 16549]KLD68632.1 hypothetical protein Y883_01155 [Luteibacter rhizovicinus DSM 16549]
MLKQSIWFAALALCVNAGTCMAKGNLWAAAGQTFQFSNNIGEWKSPDGSAQIRSDDTDVTLKLYGSVLDIADIYGSPWLSEAVWSGEARGVFVNASDGGTVGTWRTRAFVEAGGRVREIAVQKAIRTAHAITSTCTLNVVSVGWIDSGDALLVMEQVPNSSGCSHMSKAVFFVIDVKTGKIRETLTPTEAKARYSDVFGARVDDTLTLQ